MIFNLLEFQFKNKNETLVISRESGFNILSVDGLETPEVTLQTQKSAQYDGSLIIGRRLEPRVVSLKAAYLNKGDKEDMRQRLMSFFTPLQIGAVGVNNCGVKRYSDYQITSFKDNRKSLFEPLVFVVEFMCPNPYFAGEKFMDNMAATIPMLCSPFSVWNNEAACTLAFKIYHPVMTVSNSGDAATGLEIEFKATGNVSNPRLDNLTTGEFVRVVVDMVAGDRLIITTGHGEKRVALNGVNISNKKDRKSKFFQIEKGDNLLKYDADEGYVFLEVYPRWAPQYLGV